MEKGVGKAGTAGARDIRVMDKLDKEHKQEERDMKQEAETAWFDRPTGYINPGQDSPAAKPRVLPASSDTRELSDLERIAILTSKKE